jgi:hypothetical protein
MAVRVPSAGFTQLFFVSQSCNFHRLARRAHSTCEHSGAAFRLAKGEHHESAYHTHFDLNGAALFDGNICHSGTKDRAS